jgi:hypothetical protein
VNRQVYVSIYSQHCLKTSSIAQPNYLHPILLIPTAQVLVALMAIRVVLVVLTVLLLVHLLRALPSSMLGLLTVEEIQALGLSQLVDLGTSKSGDELLGKSVVHWLAFRPLTVFKDLEALESGGTGDQLVGEMGLVDQDVSLLFWV